MDTNFLCNNTATLSFMVLRAKSHVPGEITATLELALHAASPGETWSQPPSWARPFLHLRDNHTSNPPGGVPALPPWPGPTAPCNELLISALPHRSLNTSTHVFSVQCT